jgi:uncharacterized membrane protein HdeD (DUF308 family)
MATSDAELRSPTSLQRRWVWLLILGIVQLVGGLCAFAIPPAASIAAAIVFGAVLLVAGIFQLVHAASVRTWSAVALQVLGGLLYVAAGIIVLMFPLSGALTLTIVVGALLIADGVVRCVLASRIRPREGWGWFLAAGIASALLGILLLIGWPLTGLWALGILLGVNLVFSGIANCALAIAFRTRVARDLEHEALAHH